MGSTEHRLNVYFRALKDVKTGPTALRSLTFANLLIQVCVCVFCVVNTLNSSAPLKTWTSVFTAVGPPGTRLVLFVTAGSPGLPGSINTSLPSVIHWEETGAFTASSPAQAGSSLLHKQAHSQWKAHKLMEDQYFSKNNGNIFWRIS